MLLNNPVSAASLVSSASSAGSNHPLTSSPAGSAGLQSVKMAVTSAIVRPPGSPTTSVSPSQPPPSSASGGGGSGPPGTRCCDTGRPIFTDPITGQTVCSCQYELLGNYQRLGALPTAALSMYSTPYAAAASEAMAAYFPGLGGEQAPFYSPKVSIILSFSILKNVSN